MESVPIKDVLPFHDYMCSTLPPEFNNPHPQQLCEAASLSYVTLPPITYQPILLVQYKLHLAKVRNRGLHVLSGPQIEGLIYSMQRFHGVSFNGLTPGFYLGDQTGVGKTRTIAAVALECYLNKIKRGLWVSVSTDLVPDANMELDALKTHISCPEAAGFRIINHAEYANRQLPETDGILFTAYSKLQRTEMMQQILNWLGNGQAFKGLIILDECHYARNVKVTKTATCVNYLQDEYTSAKIMYVSATAGTEAAHLGYMSRLGLWGQDCLFATADEFKKDMKKREMSATELLTVELKGKGAFLARQISLKDVDFETKQIYLSDNNRDLYDMCVKVWQLLYEVMGMSQVLRSTKSLYWRLHQTFFESLSMSFKVESLGALLENYSEDDWSMVVSLQTTGEQAYIKERNHIPAGVQFSLTRTLLRVMLGKLNIPTAYGETLTEPDPTPISSSDGLTLAKDCVLQAFRKIEGKLPQNPLDRIINILGGRANVAEITGRVYRMVDKQGTREKCDVNVERTKFMTGKKKHAIISDKGSTGISLHATEGNPRRRLHIAVQFPWSAERAVQQFGRTHRSGQVNAPKYLLIVTDIPGEMRFMANFFDRIHKMGAMCQGDRKATSIAFETENQMFTNGKKASEAAKLTIEKLIKMCFNKQNATVHAQKAYKDAQFVELVERETNNTVYPTVGIPGRQFFRLLNRLLGIPLCSQAYIMDKITQKYNDLIYSAGRDGKLDDGVKEITEKWLLELAEKTVFNLKFGDVNLFKLKTDRGMRWRMVERCIAHRKAIPKFFTDGMDIMGAFVDKVKDGQVLSYAPVYSPLDNNPKELSCEDLEGWKEIKLADVEILWTKTYEDMKSQKCICSYKGACSDPFCTFKARIIHVYVLSGCLLQLWKQLSASFSKVSSATVKLQLIQTIVFQPAAGNFKLVGVFIPYKLLGAVMEILNCRNHELVTAVGGLGDAETYTSSESATSTSESESSEEEMDIDEI